MSVTAGYSDSGFHGYSYASMYPGMFVGNTQTDDTIVDVEEQQALAGVEDPAPKAVDKKKSMGIIALLVGLLVLMFLFGKG